MAVFFGSTARINAEINSLVDRGEEPHWIAMNDSSALSQKKRIQNIMQRIWPKEEPSFLDRLFNFLCERSDAMNQRWDRMHDRFFETWNRAAEKTGMTFLKAKFFHWHVDLPPESREEVIEDLFDELRPWWDFLGWVTKGRIEKVETMLDGHISQTKIAQFSPVKERVGEMLKMGMEPSQIVSALRDRKALHFTEHFQSPEYDVRYFSDDELYLIAHLALKREELLPDGGSNPAKSWSEWRLTGLKRLFEKDRIPFRMYTDLKKLDPAELDRLNREFEITPKTWMAQKTLWELGRLPAPKQLSNPLFRAAMRFEKDELWNCFPRELKQCFERVARSDVYRQAADLDLNMQLQERFNACLQEMQDEGVAVSHVPAFQKQLVEMLANELFDERFGAGIVQIKPLEDKKGGRDTAFHVRIETANRQALSFLVSLKIPYGSSNGLPKVFVERAELKDVVWCDAPSISSWWGQLTQNRRDRAFEEIFAQFEKSGERAARFKQKYQLALDLFKTVADKKKSGDTRGLLDGLKLDFAKMALQNFDHATLLFLRGDLEVLLLAAKAKRGARSEDVEILLKEFESVYALLDQLCQIKLYEKTLEEERLPAAQGEIERAFAEMHAQFQAIPLESMSQPAQLSRFRFSLEQMERRLDAIEREMKRWNLEVLEAANPELAKRAGDLLAGFEKKKGAMQQELLPYRLILNKESMDRLLHVHGRIEARIKKIRKEFPLEGIRESDARPLLREILLLESARELLRANQAVDPDLSDAMGPLMAEVNLLGSEIEAYKLALNKFVRDTFAQEEAEEIERALFEQGQDEKIDAILDLLDRAPVSLALAPPAH